MSDDEWVSVASSVSDVEESSELCFDDVQPQWDEIAESGPNGETLFVDSRTQFMFHFDEERKTHRRVDTDMQMKMVLRQSAEELHLGERPADAAPTDESDSEYEEAEAEAVRLPLDNMQVPGSEDAHGRSETEQLIEIAQTETLKDGLDDGSSDESQSEEDSKGMPELKRPMSMRWEEYGIEEQDRIRQFIDRTEADPRAAVAFLERNTWVLEAAIAQYVTGAKQKDSGGEELGATATVEVDLSRFDAEPWKKEAMLSLMGWTQLSPDDAEVFLTRFRWNLEVAADNFFRTGKTESEDVLESMAEKVVSEARGGDDDAALGAGRGEMSVKAAALLLSSNESDSDSNEAIDGHSDGSRESDIEAHKAVGGSAEGGHLQRGSMDMKLRAKMSSYSTQVEVGSSGDEAVVGAESVPLKKGAPKSVSISESTEVISSVRGGVPIRGRHRIYDSFDQMQLAKVLSNQQSTFDKEKEELLEENKLLQRLVKQLWNDRCKLLSEVKNREPPEAVSRQWSQVDAIRKESVEWRPLWAALKNALGDRLQLEDSEKVRMAAAVRSTHKHETAVSFGGVGDLFPISAPQKIAADMAYLGERGSADAVAAVLGTAALNQSDEENAANGEYYDGVSQLFGEKANGDEEYSDCVGDLAETKVASATEYQRRGPSFGGVADLFAGGEVPKASVAPLGDGGAKRRGSLEVASQKQAADGSESESAEDVSSAESSSSGVVVGYRTPLRVGKDEHRREPSFALRDMFKKAATGGQRESLSSASSQRSSDEGSEYYSSESEYETESGSFSRSAPGSEYSDASSDFGVGLPEDDYFAITSFYGIDEDSSKAWDSALNERESFIEGDYGRVQRSTRKASTIRARGSTSSGGLRLRSFEAEAEKGEDDKDSKNALDALNEANESEKEEEETEKTHKKKVTYSGMRGMFIDSDSDSESQASGSESAGGGRKAEDWSSGEEFGDELPELSKLPSGTPVLSTSKPRPSAAGRLGAAFDLMNRSFEDEDTGDDGKVQSKTEANTITVTAKGTPVSAKPATGTCRMPMAQLEAAASRASVLFGFKAAGESVSVVSGLRTRGGSRVQVDAAAASGSAVAGGTSVLQTMDAMQDEATRQKEQSELRAEMEEEMRAQLTASIGKQTEADVQSRIGEVRQQLESELSERFEERIGELQQTLSRREEQWQQQMQQLAASKLTLAKQASAEIDSLRAMIFDQMQQLQQIVSRKIT